MFDAHKRSGKPGGNDWPRLVVLSFNLISLRAYNANYDDDIYNYMHGNNNYKLADYRIAKLLYI